MPKSTGRRSQPIEVSIILPCLDEELTVGTCVRKSFGFLNQQGIRGEVIVADNGSTDNSARVASSLGATVIRVEDRGYGNAVRAGIDSARGKYLIMADADDSYDLENLLPFVERLRAGFDLVMGNRFRGGIRRGAMPWHHRYIGNPILSFLGRLFFKSPVGDFHCGLRGFSRAAARRMDLRTTGMEFASEIVIKASLLDMNVSEVPAVLYPDGRQRPPHLRSFRDGWRHLRFLLIYSPRWVFTYPGLILFALGTLLSIALFLGPIRIGLRLVDFHSFIITGTMMIVGINMLAFSTITQVYAFNTGLLPSRPGFYALFKYLNLEKGLAAGFMIIVLGLLLVLRAVSLSSEFSTIGFNQSVRLVFGGSLALILGGQIVLTSFVLSILGLDITKR